jgi:hypothetical protein
MKNKFEIVDSVTKVFLSSKDGVIESLIDTKSLEVLNEFEGTFRAVWSDKTKSFYAMGYEPRYGKGKNVMMHRWITGVDGESVIDHINHDTLDNRLCNLAITSQSKNMHNPDMRKLQGRIPGVRWYENKQKWRVVVTVRGKQNHLGYFDDKREAIKVAEEFRKTI